jgi:hypothetical protein
MPEKRIRRVVVLAGTSLGWREKIMRGISNYAHDRGPWHIFMEPEGAEDSLFFSENYRWDGLIVRVINGPPPVSNSCRRRSSSPPPSD